MKNITQLLQQDNNRPQIVFKKPKKSQVVHISLNKQNHAEQIEAANIILSQVTVQKLKGKSSALGLLNINDPLRKIPRYQREIIQSALFGKKQTKKDDPQQQFSAYNASATTKSETCKTSKKIKEVKNRNVIVRRVQSSHMSAVHQSHKSIK